MTATDHPPPPGDAALLALLEAHAPPAAVPLCPEIEVFQARSLVDIWEAAEHLAGDDLPSPFWAYAWPAGSALARVILDRPQYVRGRFVLDFGAGGGVASLAAAAAGADRVVANDIDPWAVAVARLAAERQRVRLTTLHADLTRDPESAPDFDVLLCSDLAYERAAAPGQLAFIQAALHAGRTVLVADAGRTYFDDCGLEQLAAYEIRVPDDLEGVSTRTARVYGGGQGISDLRSAANHDPRVRR